MQFKQWILNETDWPLFLTEGEEQVLALTRSILGGNEELLNQLKDPNQTAEEEDEHGINYIIELKYLPAFAFFSHQSGASNSLEVMSGRLKSYFDKLKTLVDKGKIKWAKEGQATVNGVVIDDNKGNKALVTDYLKFTEIIDGMYNLQKPSTRSGKNDARPVDAKPIFSKNGLDIYESNSPQACIKYGEGYGFCISQPGNTEWKSYRDMQASTFYFVFDRTLDKSDPLHIVVVDMTEHGPQLTDANNTTGSISGYKSAEGYLNHLYGRGVPKDLFKNIPKTPEEEAENRKLGRVNEDLDFFKRLSYEEKSKYIGRGHSLTDEQFDLLWDNKTKDLLNQYVNIGIKLTDHQSKKVLTKKDLKESYLRKRWIAYEVGHDRRQVFHLGTLPQIADFTVNSFSKLEFDNLKQEQQESIKKEIEINFDRVEIAADGHRQNRRSDGLPLSGDRATAAQNPVLEEAHDVFIKIYLIYEKGHHDIAELATLRLKKYVKESGYAKLMMHRSDSREYDNSGIQGFRKSIPFVHAIIKDVLVSDHDYGYTVSGNDINDYLRKTLDAMHHNVGARTIAIARNDLTEIDMIEKRLKNNNWPGIWSGETQATQIIDILVKAGANTPQAKERLGKRRSRAMEDYQKTLTKITLGGATRFLPQDEQKKYVRIQLATEKIKVHYLEFLIRYLDGLVSPTKDVS